LDSSASKLVFFLPWLLIANILNSFHFKHLLNWNIFHGAFMLSHYRAINKNLEWMMKFYLNLFTYSTVIETLNFPLKVDWSRKLNLTFFPLIHFQKC
jgi:hypothetical protein